jgi:DNA polymerase-3 subunit delta
MAKRAATTRSKTAGNTLDASARMVVLHGPEQMIQRLHHQTLRDALAEAHGQIDTIHFDGKSVELAEVFDELRGYSLMATYKLVVVDDADEFVKKHREPLERYAQSPVDHATLLLRADTWHKGNLDKHIAQVGAVIKCEPPPPGEAVSWLVQRAAEHHHRRLDRDAAALLVERMGVHLMALDSELGKLSAMVGENAAINRAAVEQAVGKSSDEQAWAVQSKLLTGMGKHSAGDMIRAVHEMIDDAGQPEVLVMYFAADLLRKLALGSAMKRAGENDATINKMAKVWGPNVAPFQNVLRKTDAATARRMLDLALTLDARGKSGFGEPTRNLERLCVTLADEDY